MRVLVTGGAGFIGGHLVEALHSRGHAVAALDDLSSGVRENVPQNVPLYEVDIRNQEDVLRAVLDFKPDRISHQAAQMSVSRSVREPAFDAEVNILGLIHVCAAAAQAGCRRIVFASSGGVLYGDVSKPAPEETLADPQSPYGISKWAGERYLQFFVREHGIQTVALRYANVYGPRQNPHGEAGVVAIFCTKMLAGEACTINGDGRYIRDYVHVFDVVAANLLALEQETPGFTAYNVGTGIGTDVNELAAQVRAGCQRALSERQRPANVPAPVHGPPRPGDLRSNLVSAEKIGRELGWRPQVDISSGLSSTVDWFADRLLTAAKP